MNAPTAFAIFIVIIAVVFLLVRNRPEEQSGDYAITAAVNAAIAKEFPATSIQIDVKTFSGVVILGGFTREFSQKERAEELARAVPGVKSVDSRITVRSGG